jgi:hypothetical protein
VALHVTAGAAKRIAFIVAIWASLFILSVVVNWKAPEGRTQAPPGRVVHYIFGYFVFGWIKDTLPYGSGDGFIAFMRGFLIVELLAAAAFIVNGRPWERILFLVVFILRMGISFLLFVLENSGT